MCPIVCLSMRLYIIVFDITDEIKPQFPCNKLNMFPIFGYYCQPELSHNCAKSLENYLSLYLLIKGNTTFSFL